MHYCSFGQRKRNQIYWVAATKIDDYFGFTAKSLSSAISSMA